MSLQRVVPSLLALIVVLAAASTGRAQHHIQPFDELQFDKDYQLFAPAVTSEYGGEPVAAHTGLWATFDRVYMNVTNPNSTNPFMPTDGEFTWGNRFEAGYMTEEREGWTFGYLHVNGPNEYLFRNFQTNFVGTVFTENSINVATLTSVELNRVFRSLPLHNGSRFEPYLGVRWFQFDDFLKAQTFDGSSGDDVFAFTTAKTANTMLAGQVGLRWWDRRGNWILSGDIRGFAAENWGLFRTLSSAQTFTSATTSTTVYGPVIKSGFAEFVYGGELRVDVSYEVSRAVAIHVGLQAIDFVDGIGRGDITQVSNPDRTQILRQSQDVFIVGLAFGVSINR